MTVLQGNIFSTFIKRVNNSTAIAQTSLIMLFKVTRRYCWPMELPPQILQLLINQSLLLVAASSSSGTTSVLLAPQATPQVATLAF
jgi:hypothetical protein